LSSSALYRCWLGRRGREEEGKRGKTYGFDDFLGDTKLGGGRGLRCRDLVGGPLTLRVLWPSDEERKRSIRGESSAVSKEGGK
jgi:hypothetical protein